MRVLALLLLAFAAEAEPVRWSDFPAALTKLLTEAGVGEDGFAAWLARHDNAARERLAEGSAEHITYYLLQTKELGVGPELNPAVEARKYLDSLPAAERSRFLAGGAAAAPFAEPVRRRMEAFGRVGPVSERHRVLRELAGGLGWTNETIVQTAFRFLMRRAKEDDADTLYQARGLSADPFPASMMAVERGLAWLRKKPASVLLAGPGADLGSRFGLEDSKPVASPQPGALLTLLGTRPERFDCVDIRPEVTQSLRDGPCRGTTLDLVSERLPVGRYDLAVATNLLVYLDDRELAVAMGNLAGALRQGGCLLHNDGRFAARLFGEAAGIPVVHFESIGIGRRGGWNSGIELLFTAGLDNGCLKCEIIAALPLQEIPCRDSHTPPCCWRPQFR